MSAAYRPATSENACPFADVTMRTSVGLLILVVHALAIYMLRSPFSIHGLQNSTTLSFVAPIIEASRPTLSLDIPSPAIPKVDLTPAMFGMPVAEIDESPNTRFPHFEPAKPDLPRSVVHFVVAPIGGPHAASTITLLVEVLADGSVGQVEIKASAGTELDAAAKSYVRKLHWTPANVGGKPTAMKVLYSLTL